MNTAIDINSMPVRASYLDPDEPDPQLEQEAREAAVDSYVDDWVRGNLADVDDVFSGPLQALIDEDGEALGDLLRAYRSRDPHWFDHMAGRVARALEKHVRGQA